MSVWENLGYEFVRNTMVGLMQRGCVGSKRELKTGAGTEHQLWKLDATVLLQHQCTMPDRPGCLLLSSCSVNSHYSLFGQPVRLLNQSGSAAGERHLPPRLEDHVFRHLPLRFLHSYQAPPPHLSALLQQPAVALHCCCGVIFAACYSKDWNSWA